MWPGQNMQLRSHPVIPQPSLQRQCVIFQNIKLRDEQQGWREAAVGGGRERESIFTIYHVFIILLLVQREGAFVLSSVSVSIRTTHELLVELEWASEVEREVLTDHGLGKFGPRAIVTVGFSGAVSRVRTSYQYQWVQRNRFRVMVLLVLYYISISSFQRNVRTVKKTLNTA